MNSKIIEINAAREIKLSQQENFEWNDSNLQWNSLILEWNNLPAPLLIGEKKVQGHNDTDYRRREGELIDALILFIKDYSVILSQTALTDALTVQ